MKTIFFDFDGVLTPDSTGTWRTIQNLHQYYPNIDIEHLTSVYRSFQKDFNCGLTDIDEVFGDFCDQLGKNVDLEQIKQAYRETPKNEVMLELVRNIRSNGVQTGIITNNSRLRFKILTEYWNLPELFNFIIVSANVGLSKPEKYIFEKALELSNSKAEEAVFIDNQEKNLVAPKELGMKTYFYDHELNEIEKLSSQLKAWGVPV